MTEDHSSELLGQLPRTRPHRRSAKRPARPSNVGPNQPTPAPAKSRATNQVASKPAGREQTGAKAHAGKAHASKAPRRKPAEPRAKPLAQPAQPRGVPTAARERPSQQKRGKEAPAPVLRTAAQAASELAEIGVTLSTRALRRAIGRLPRP